MASASGGRTVALTSSSPPRRPAFAAGESATASRTRLSGAIGDSQRGDRHRVGLEERLGEFAVAADLQAKLLHALAGILDAEDDFRPRSPRNICGRVVGSAAGLPPSVRIVPPGATPAAAAGEWA